MYRSCTKKSKQKYKGIILKDGKRLCGIGRLTNKAISTLQNYYRMVIRLNVGDLYGMKRYSLNYSSLLSK